VQKNQANQSTSVNTTHPYIALKLHILSLLAFPGNQTHDLGDASTILYCLSYRKNYNYKSVH